MKLLRIFIIFCGAMAQLMRPAFSFIKNEPRKITSTSRKLRANNEYQGVSLASLLYEEGTVQIPRGDNTFSLYYRVYNRNATGAPVVMCHGGPSLPSQYMYPIAALLYDYPVLFYDQLGCGKSEQPRDLSFYSIQQFVKDLQQVVTAIVAPGHSSFHLFGHSFGGILAFEFLRSYLQHSNPPRPTCQSVFLSNAPTNIKQCSNDYDRLYARNPLSFWKQHACRIGTPPALDDAMKHAGTVWMGMDAVLDYKATPLVATVDGLPKRPQLLVVSCARDFAYPSSNEKAWNGVIPDSYRSETRFVQFEDCRHYPFYEDEAAYGTALRNFLTQVEGRN